MTLSVLGQEYEITKKKYADDPFFAEKHFDGYCNEWSKEIVVCDMSTYEGWDKESPETIKACEMQTLRHEIVHAFFNESGLSYSSNAIDEPWAKNEEMVDWFATQGPKIYQAWKAAGAIE